MANLYTVDDEETLWFCTCYVEPRAMTDKPAMPRLLQDLGRTDKSTTISFSSSNAVSPPNTPPTSPPTSPSTPSSSTPTTKSHPVQVPPLSTSKTRSTSAGSPLSPTSPKGLARRNNSRVVINPNFLQNKTKSKTNEEEQDEEDSDNSETQRKGKRKEKSTPRQAFNRSASSSTLDEIFTPSQNSGPSSSFDKLVTEFFTTLHNHYEEEEAALEQRVSNLDLREEILAQMREKRVEELNEFIVKVGKFQALSKK